MAYDILTAVFVALWVLGLAGVFGLSYIMVQIARDKTCHFWERTLGSWVCLIILLIFAVLMNGFATYIEGRMT